MLPSSKHLRSFWTLIRPQANLQSVMEWTIYATIVFTMIHCCVRTNGFMILMTETAVQISPQATESALERVRDWDSITFLLSAGFLFLSMVLVAGCTIDELKVRLTPNERRGFEVIQ